MAHLTWLFIWTYAVYTHICGYLHDRIHYAFFSIRFHADVRKTRNAYSHMKKTHARLCWAPMYMWSDELRSRFRSMLFDLASILKFALLCFYSLWSLFQCVWSPFLFVSVSTSQTFPTRPDNLPIGYWIFSDKLTSNFYLSEFLPCSKLK